MHIHSEKDITGVAAKHLREQANLTQKAFWNSLGLTQSGGSRYEQGQALPKPIRILLFAIYVAGLRLDASTDSGAAGLHRLAQIQASESAADREKIGQAMLAAKSYLTRAAGLLAGIAH